MPENYCFNSKNSCNACCGIYNLKLSAAEREEWLQSNTEQFLQLDITQAANIVAFRQEGEGFLEQYKIHEETYVCPFVGYINNKTGCLLHPVGSPHPQISHWQHPQNFSFYGEGICLDYDCLSKEEQLLDNLRVKKKNYGLLLANHNLLRTYRFIVQKKPAIAVRIWQFIENRLKRHLYPVTSFQLPVKDLAKKEISELLKTLALLLNAEGYTHDNIIESKKSERTGKALLRLFNT